MKYFIDTEFHEHKKPIKFLGITIAKVWTIDLISIGIKCEDGREYYAINRDLNLKYAKKDKWLKINVLDKLPPKIELYPPFGKEHTCSEIVKKEIEWQDVRIATAIKLAKMIEYKQDEIDEFTRAKQSEIQELINQLKSL